jgi:hypothetical protein
MIANPRNFPHKFEKRNERRKVRTAKWQPSCGGGGGEKRECCEATRTAKWQSSRAKETRECYNTAAPLWYPTLESLQSQATSAMHDFCFPFPLINDMEQARVCRPRIPGFALPLLLPSCFFSFFLSHASPLASHVLAPLWADELLGFPRRFPTPIGDEDRLPFRKPSGIVACLGKGCLASSIQQL